MITQQMTNIVLVLGFIFLVCPVLLACFYRLYRWGFFPRIGKKGD